jgi:SPP1 family predicted phage head-tail adaptor
MDAGQLDRRVTLQRKGAETDDGFNTVPGGWADLADVWARFIPLTGAERAAASQTEAFGKANWEIRKDSSWADLNAKDRLTVKDTGQAFNIVNVTEPRRGFLLIESVAASD